MPTDPDPLAGQCETPARTCNRHSDCDAAERRANEKAGHRVMVDHCHDETCEDCFGY